jgi:hypothetical protein
MAFNLTQTLINSHLVSGNMKPGNEIQAVSLHHRGIRHSFVCSELLDAPAD